MLTWVEISKIALQNNLKSFRKLVGRAALLIPVVKSNAYGHGLCEIAKICDDSPDVDRIAVVNIEEALILRLFNIKKPIHILSFFDLDESKIAEGIKKHVIFPLYSLKQAELLNSIALHLGLKCKVHLKIDTGTSRVGIKIEQLESFLKSFKAYNKIDIEGLWSHFSSSESDDKITKKQNESLIKASKILNDFGFETPIIHISCTAATILHPFSRNDAVRIGLGIYGLYPSNRTRKKIDLKPVMSWKTKIIQVKRLKKGEPVGYGETYRMKKDGLIAVLPVGYYDGYDRAWSNIAEVLINGKKCPVRGRICMNLTMVEVTDVKNCSEGTVVTLLGKDGKNTISAEYLANLTEDTINYEVITKINPLITRIVV